MDIATMELATCDARISDLVLGMTNEGILNDQFIVLVGARRAGDHFLVVNVINRYCSMIEKALTLFSHHLRQPDIDYPGLTVWAGHIRTKACCAGTESIRIASFHFMTACTFRNKQQCLDLLNILYREYFHLRAKFMTILQMEVRIICLIQHVANTSLVH